MMIIILLKREFIKIMSIVLIIRLSKIAVGSLISLKMTIHSVPYIGGRIISGKKALMLIS